MWPDILSSRYRLGGRRPGVALDCLGTCAEIGARIHACVGDPWKQIHEDWLAGKIDASSALPKCRVRAEPGAALRHGDLLLFYPPAPAHPWVAIVAFGHVWSADAKIGSPYGRRIDLWTRRPDEHWHHDPSLHSQGHPRH